VKCDVFIHELPNETTFNDLLVTSDPDFKVTTSFDIEYPRNDTR